MRRTLISRGGEGLEVGVGAGVEQEVRSKRQRAKGLWTESRIQLAAFNENQQGYLFVHESDFFTSRRESKGKRCVTMRDAPFGIVVVK